MVFNQSRPFGITDLLSLDSQEHDGVTSVPLKPETVSFSLHAACA